MNDARDLTDRIKLQLSELDALRDQAGDVLDADEELRSAVDGLFRLVGLPVIGRPE